MKWIKRSLVLVLAVAVVVLVAALLTKVDQTLEIKPVVLADKPLCEVTPNFSLQGNLLKVTFAARAESAYIFSDEADLTQYVVPENKKIAAELQLHPGVNLVYFSYVEAKPEKCWLNYNLRADLN